MPRLELSHEELMNKISTLFKILKNRFVEEYYTYYDMPEDGEAWKRIHYDDSKIGYIVIYEKYICIEFNSLDINKHIHIDKEDRVIRCTSNINLLKKQYTLLKELVIKLI